MVTGQQNPRRNYASMNAASSGAIRLLYLWLAQVDSNFFLLEASVFHNLPVIDSHAMMALLGATHQYTATGTLWNTATWSKKLNRKLSLFHWSTPSHPIHLPQDDAAFTDDP